MKHGTRATYYAHRCRCVECRRAAADYERQRSRDRAYGRPTQFVKAERVRQHWLWLRSLGMTDDDIEAAAGVSHHTSHNLFRGHWRTGKPVERMKRETAEKVLAVKSPSRPAMGLGSRVPSTKVKEWLLDLMEQGYSQAWVAEQIGVLRSNFDPWQRQSVSVKTHLAVKRLWESTTEPAPEDTPKRRQSATRSRNRARAIRKRTMPDGQVRVRVERIEEAIGDRPLSHIEADAGLASGQLYRIITRGGCRESTIEKLASALGVEVGRFVACVSQQSC